MGKKKRELRREKERTDQCLEGKHERRDEIREKENKECIVAASCQKCKGSILL